MARKLLFWLHLAAGITTGAIILVMAATGTLLTYQRQITTWADLRGIGNVPRSGAAPLPVADLLARVSAVRTGTQATSITWRETGGPVEVVLGRTGRVFVDPWNGRVVGEGSAGVRKFFQRVVEWHRWLGQSGANREGAARITAIANLAFLVLITTGAFLWWPRNWSMRAVRNLTFFRRGLSAKAREFNWHHVIGFWIFLPLFLVVLSGVVISYGWAGDMVYRLVGETPPSAVRRESVVPTREPQRAGATARHGADAVANFDVMLAQSAQRMPEWRSMTLQIPSDGSRTVTVVIDGGTGGQPQRRAQLKFERATGRVIEWLPFSASTKGRKLRAILRFTHTGEIGGLLGQTIAGVASLGATVLVYTGLALSMRRFSAWRARNRRLATR
jgi:uncharacterized iron-regulated membrane protein